jgi:lysyl-tRNA synthetase, class II
LHHIPHFFSTKQEKDNEDEKKINLNNLEERYRNRHIDFLVNKEVREVFLMRGKIIKFLRNFLDEKGFLEVETPVLQKISGGANAKRKILIKLAFKTYLNAHDMELKLRISPELYLKRLIISGFPKVYEIGKVFRNEGVDNTHNPEFTSCELYEAYSDYEELMKFTEEFLSKLVFSLFNTYKVNYKNTEIDFSPPFKRMDYIKKLELILNEKIPNEKDENSIMILKDFCKLKNISIEEKKVSYGYLLDRLSKLIELEMIQPTFLLHHPIQISPLSKLMDENKFLTQRFELFINSFELCNSYTELNDPNDQRERFKLQNILSKNDDEAHENDSDFCDSLEFGLPPTGYFLKI